MSDLITKDDVTALFGEKNRPEDVAVWCASWSGVEVGWLSKLTGRVQGWLALGGKEQAGLVIVEAGPPELPDTMPEKTWVLEGELFCADAETKVSVRLHAERFNTLSVHAVAEQDLDGWSLRPDAKAVARPWSGARTMWATDDTALGRHMPDDDRRKGRRILQYRTYWEVPDDGAVAPVMTVFRGF